MKRAVHTTLVMSLLLATASPVLGASFIERIYGTPQLGLSPRSRAMGGAGAAFGITLLTLVYGGDGTPVAFASAFGWGAALSLGSLLAAAFMGAPRRPSPGASDPAAP